jgi:peptidyl-prolyl cis-trans isomerase SurA
MLNGIWKRTCAAIGTGLLLVAVGAAPSFAQAARATVNGEVITDNQVAQRVRLFTLEGNRGGTGAAIDQLIDEAIMIQEARRLGITVSPSQIDAAYLSVARNIRVSKEVLDQMLQRQGTSVQTLRDRLEATIAWNSVVEQAVVPQVQISDLELDQQAASRATASESFDYILKEIIFIAPGGQGASGRTGQANNYRSAFVGCDSAVELSLNYTDAAVIDVGRRHATQLPDAVAQELAGMNVGGITRPRVTDRGVSMLAICEKAQANDLTFIKNEIRREAGQDAMKGAADEYLANLRSQARIVRN